MPNLYRKGKYWWCWGYDAERQRWYQSTKQISRRAAERVARRIVLERSQASRFAYVPLQKALTLLVQTARRNKRSAATIEIRLAKSANLTRLLGADRDLHSIMLADVEKYLDTRRKEGVSDHTVLKEIGTLRAAMGICKTHGLFQGEPGSIMPREALRGAYKPRERWLTLDEYSRLVAALSPSLRDYVVIWVNTGLRFSEVFKIERDDVDLQGRTLRARGTKTERADRLVPINDLAATTLRSRMLLTPMFPELWRGNVLRDLAKGCERAGIARVSPNDLRRTFASWLANEGVPELTVARLMGHTSSFMVRHVYAQLGDETLRAAVDKMPRPPLAKPQKAKVTPLRKGRRS